jgi:hypothetical protein
MIHPPRVFSLESSSLRMPFAIKTSCFARFFMKTKSWILSLKVLLPKLPLFNPRTMIQVPNHVTTAKWLWLTMQICGLCILMSLACLMVLEWNSESSKLIPHYLVLAPLVLCLNLVCLNRFPCRPGFPAGGSYTHFEPRHLDCPRFPRRGSRPTRPSGEVQRTVKTSSGRMVMSWIPKIYLTNPSTKPSTFSRPV